jgi:hypothetical protein
MRAFLRKNPFNKKQSRSTIVSLLCFFAMSVNPDAACVYMVPIRACRGGCTVVVCHGTCHCRHRGRNGIKLIKKYYKIKIMNSAPAHFVLPGESD